MPSSCIGKKEFETLDSWLLGTPNNVDQLEQSEYSTWFLSVNFTW